VLAAAPPPSPAATALRVAVSIAHAGPRPAGSERERRTHDRAPDGPVRHTAADTPNRLERGAFRRVLRVVEDVLSR
jgi:hypothetical protein